MVLSLTLNWIADNNKENNKGMKIYDPGHLNTALVRLSIFYIDGDEGILKYTRYSIDELAERVPNKEKFFQIRVLRLMLWLS